MPSFILAVVIAWAARLSRPSGPYSSTAGRSGTPHTFPTSAVVAASVGWATIPPALSDIPQWIPWRWERKDGKWTKIPLDTRNPARSASVTDPTCRGSFDGVKAIVEAGKASGGGFVFTDADDFAGVDIDDCRDPETGELSQIALDAIAALDSYAEVTPSGRGIHIWVRAPGASFERKKFPDLGVELYTENRYFTVTGDALPGRKTIEVRGPELETWWQSVEVLDVDEKLLRRARAAKNGAKFAALYDRGEGDYPSDSEADLALCSMIAFWTEDEQQIDRLFRRSALMREKWNRDDYRDATLAKALEVRRRSGGAAATASEAVSPEVITAQFFDENTFRAERLARWITDETPVAKAGGRLFVYQDGVYKRAQQEDDGDDSYGTGDDGDLNRRILDALTPGERWTSARRDQVLKLLYDAAPLLRTPPLDVLNVRNGLLTIEGRRLAPHRPEHLSQARLGAAYDPEAKCPTFDRWLVEALPDPEVRRVVQEVAGYLLTPDISQQVAVLLRGTGSNGKSVLLAVLVELLGRDCVSHLSLHDLDGNRFAAAALHGRLANICGDLDAHEVRSSAKFKEITGGDRIQVEHKYGRSFQLKPYARLVFSANAAPPTRDATPAFLRRWLVIPFDQEFRGANDDKHLLQRLLTQNELSGILNWALDGLDRLRAQGAFSGSSATDTAKDRFRIEVDSVAAFADECCEWDPRARVKRQVIYELYAAWCRRNGRRPVSIQNFGGGLRRAADAVGAELDNGQTRVKKDRVWVGVALRDVPWV